MNPRPRPFTSWPFGRLTPVEESSCLDASELAWSGALDGSFDFDAWPWTGWAERELDLCERGWLHDAVRPVRGIVCIEAPDRIVVEIRFRVAATRLATGIGEDWRQRLFLVSRPCHFGGRRWWFECWLCGRRCARLYRDSPHCWECSTCARRTYKSRQSDNWYSRHGSRWRWFRRFLDRDESAVSRCARRTMRRSLSRWRKNVRAREDCLEAWPVQVTCAPACAPIGDS